MSMNSIPSNKLKRICFSALVILSSFVLGGCSQSNVSAIGEAEEKNVPLVVSTIFPGYDFAREVGKNRIVDYQLLKPGAESHTYEPTPQDMILIRECDVFIYAGGESDTWMEDILADESKPDRIVISMMDCVKAVTEEESEGMREGGVLAGLLGEEEEEELDEHVWTSPVNAGIISEKLCDALCVSSPENASFYRDNTEDFQKRLSDIDERYRKMVSDASRNVIVVGDRFPFRYLCDEYGLTYYAAFPGCAEDAEVTADSLVKLCDIVQTEKIPVVFNIEFSSGKIADSICECTGATGRELHSAHNISAYDLKQGVTYLDILERNLETLKEALY